MQDIYSEQISGLIDGELSEDEMNKIISVIQSDAGLQGKLDRYGLIRSAIRLDQLPSKSVDISEGVRELVQNEPTVLAPSTPRWGNWRRKGVAMAASVMVLAVLVAYQLPETASPGQLSALGEQQQNLADIAAQSVAANDATDSANLTAKVMPNAGVQSPPNFDAYLLNHNQNASLMQVPGMLPSARLVTYGKE